ncbi:MAG: type 1 glutamine amidotransferase domain-containing protein [bacterium]
MELQGKTIGILAENHYEDLELWYPYYRFIEAGATVKIIGSGTEETYKGKYGYPVTPEVDIIEVDPPDFDAIIIPGGFAPDFMRRVPRMIEFVRASVLLGKIVAAICHGPWMLASANVLHGKKATCFFAIADDIRNAGAHYLDQEVVRDGNIITSRKPSDLPAFCREIIQTLNNDNAVNNGT